MQPFRLKIRKIIAYSATLAVLLYAGFVLATAWPLNKETLKPHAEGLAKVGTIITVLGIFWAYYDRRGWRQKPFRLLGISPIPDLRGRWEGTVHREGDHELPHRFALEISQTATSVRVAGFTEHSKSRSVSAQILFDQSEEHVYLIETWTASTSNRLNGRKSGLFQGTTIFTLSLDNPRQLEGEYFTDRVPYQTRGKLRLELSGKKCRGRF